MGKIVPSPTLHARLVASFLASERRGEEIADRFLRRFSDSLTRWHETTEWVQIVWATWRTGDPDVRSPVDRGSDGERSGRDSAQ